MSNKKSKQIKWEKRCVDSAENSVDVQMLPRLIRTKEGWLHMLARLDEWGLSLGGKIRHEVVHNNFSAVEILVQS